MNLATMASVVIALVERRLPPGTTGHGIVFPIRIEVGSGAKVLQRYFNLFVHRTPEGVMVGAHRPTGTQLVQNPKSLSDWKLLTHHEEHWREKGIIAYLIEMHTTLANEFAQAEHLDAVSVELMFTHQPKIIDIERAVTRKSGILRLKFPEAILTAA